MGRMKFINNVTYDDDIHRDINLAKLNEENFDSVYGNVHARPELIIYEPSRVKKLPNLRDLLMFSLTGQLMNPK